MTALRTTTALIAALVVVALPLTAFAGGRPQGVSPTAYDALDAQGQALNARYGTAVTKLSSRGFTELWRDGGSKLSPDALNALVVRSQEMNAAAAEQFHGVPPATYAELQAQGEALNARYGNAVTTLAPQQFAELYDDGGSKLGPEALNALVVRSQEMNKAAAATSVPTVTGPADNSFAWSEFGMGAAATAGLILLLGGIGVAVRTGRRTGVATRVG